MWTKQIVIAQWFFFLVSLCRYSLLALMSSHTCSGDLELFLTTWAAAGLLPEPEGRWRSCSITGTATGHGGVPLRPGAGEEGYKRYWSPRSGTGASGDDIRYHDTPGIPLHTVDGGGRDARGSFPAEEAEGGSPGCGWWGIVARGSGGEGGFYWKRTESGWTIPTMAPNLEGNWCQAMNLTVRMWAGMGMWGT